MTITMLIANTVQAAERFAIKGERSVEYVAKKMGRALGDAR
jgi:hypothetical protein